MACWRSLARWSSDRLAIEAQYSRRYFSSDTTDLLLEGTYLLSSRRAGSHSIVFGYDGYNDHRDEQSPVRERLPRVP